MAKSIESTLDGLDKLIEYSGMEDPMPDEEYKKKYPEDYKDTLKRLGL